MSQTKTLKEEIKQIIEDGDKRVEYLRKQNANCDDDISFGRYKELESMLNRLEELLK